MQCPAQPPLRIVRNAKRVRVVFNSRVVADSCRSLTLSEVGREAVHYIPRVDVDTFLLERTSHETYCPYKGDAAHYSIEVGGRSAQNAAWSYEQPYPAVEAIRAYLAFYPDQVDQIEELQEANAGSAIAPELGRM